MTALNKPLRGATLILLFILVYSSSRGQDLRNARRIADTLASPSMYGRGYVNNGCAIAADFIANEMKLLGLKPFGQEFGFKQDFTVNVKTYPSQMSLTIGGKVLRPGYEFAVFTGSPTIKGSFSMVSIDSSSFKKNGSLKRLKKDLSTTFISYDPSLMKGKYRRMADSLLKYNFVNCAGFIHLTSNQSPVYSVVSPLKALDYPIFTVTTSSIPKPGNQLSVDIEMVPLNDYKISNVIGFIQGTTEPDSFIVLTAHYDHLGMLGRDVYFPGANDNASGTAMILDMARYFSKEENRPEYSMVFMAFAGEEIGLKGSKYYVEHPLFPLEKIKFLINLDMVGTGSEGITMVNANQFPCYYNKMVKLNADNEYIMKVAKRGESCNSDHCPFYQKGVPAVFIYSMGKEHTEYHNPNDKAEKVPFTEYNDIFSLIRDFIISL